MVALGLLEALQPRPLDRRQRLSTRFQEGSLRLSRVQLDGQTAHPCGAEAIEEKTDERGGHLHVQPRCHLWMTRQQAPNSDILGDHLRTEVRTRRCLLTQG